ncbi:MAG: M24 family metallopeptidase [Lachnospiraceae bacterium]|nr:M24 family metallopeptidase [Lachnospiraceae bacterium]
MGYRSADMIQYKEVSAPKWEKLGACPELPEIVYTERLERLYSKMNEENLDVVVLYADREHYSNFRYLAAFEPRFEEGILVIHRNGKNYVLLGNECFCLYQECKFTVTPILCQILSLPNQTMEQFSSMENMFEKAEIKKGMKVGIVGWKLFTGNTEAKRIFDVPSYIVESLKNVVGKENMENATDLFISPAEGIRIINDVHTIAQMEHGAAQASRRVAEMLEALEPGKTEEQLGAYLNPRGKVMSCHPYLVAGENRFRGLISVTDYAVRKGDALCTSMGLEGGLTNRAGYIAEDISDLKEAEQDYLEKLAKPYFAAVATWYEMIGIGVTGGAMYEAVQSIIPKEIYGWVLNPGHLIATEEWLSSPIYPGSDIEFKSGMLVQMDIGPGMEGYGGPNCEDGICIADEELQKELEKKYPDVWRRMNERKAYMKDVIGIHLKPEVFPMSDLAGWYNPLFLNRQKAFVVENIK